MATSRSSDTSPGRDLFPGYWTIDGLVASEVDGLTDEQLDWVSDRWEWSAWSIRNQVSHMASLTFRWLIERWGDQLYPGGAPVSKETYEKLSSPTHDRRLDDDVFWKIDDVLAKFRDGLNLARDILDTRTAAELRSLKVTRHATAQWALMSQAHPTGVEPGSDGNNGTMTLEATFRHMYFEYVTHLYNVQRLKRAQGLHTVVQVPREGYWTLPGWDTSEPGDAA